MLDGIVHFDQKLMDYFGELAGPDERRYCVRLDSWVQGWKLQVEAVRLPDLVLSGVVRYIKRQFCSGDYGEIDTYSSLAVG